MSGIVFSVLIGRYGCRIVVLIGSVVWFIGFGVSAVAPNVVVLCFSYGIIAGMFHCLYILLLSSTCAKSVIELEQILVPILNHIRSIVDQIGASLLL